jgi:hypothetical protein
MFDTGTKATITRGKYRGKVAEILSAADPEGQHAVKLEDGTVAVVNASNLKAPDEATISEAKLAAEIQTAAGDESDNPSVLNALAKLVSRLSGDMPGLGARISWPMAEGPDEIQR